MILLDTHVLVWWVHGDRNLPSGCSELLQQRQDEGLAISIISCWEIANLVEYQRLILPCPITEWFTQALAYPNIQLLNLTPQIAIESTQLPQPFHRDPADQLIVATARVYDCPLMTLDIKIRSYPYITALPLC